MDDVDRRTIAEALGGKGFTVETDALLDSYLTTMARFDQVSGQVGVQFTTEGHGKSLDDRHEPEQPLEQDGTPAKVVLDVVSEQGDHNVSNTASKVRPNFWASRTPRTGADEHSDELPANAAILTREESQDPEVPKRPPSHPLPRCRSIPTSRSTTCTATTATASTWTPWTTTNTTPA